jgi:hypothetical protein
LLSRHPDVNVPVQHCPLDLIGPRLRCDLLSATFLGLPATFLGLPALLFLRLLFLPPTLLCCRVLDYLTCSFDSACEDVTIKSSATASSKDGGQLADFSFQSPHLSQERGELCRQWSRLEFVETCGDCRTIGTVV